MFTGANVIFTYTRQQAIEEGVLIDLSGVFPDISRQLFIFPVACTAEVWGIIERAVNNPQHCNDFQGVVWDLLWMSQKGIVRKIDDSEHIFRVIIVGAGCNRYYDFKIQCHPGDQGEPVLTIMMPHED